MLLDGGLRVAGNVSGLIQARVSLVAALKLGAATITHTLDVERVGELQQPVLMLGKFAEVRGRWSLETLSSLEGS